MLGEEPDLQAKMVVPYPSSLMGGYNKGLRNLHRMLASKVPSDDREGMDLEGAHLI